MRIGVPKEIKVHEYRVGLTPTSVREVVAAGHQVVVESNAGAGIVHELPRIAAVGKGGLLRFAHLLAGHHHDGSKSF